MDVAIVNEILRMCYDQQTCLFEVQKLSEHCVAKKLCQNSKQVLASINNYTEIFKISRDRSRIELFMPFEICRHHCLENFSSNEKQICSNLHVCHDLFYLNTCRRSNHCPHPHILNEKHQKNLSKNLFQLDLDALSKAFRINCQSKKHLLNYCPSASSSSRQAPTNVTPPILNNSNVSSSFPSSSLNGNTWRLPPINLNRKLIWKTFMNHPIVPQTISISENLSIVEIGIQVFWTPDQQIPVHFIEVAYSNSSKSDGGPLRFYQVYQHLGIAHIFFEEAQIAERVVNRGLISFHAFQLTAKLLERTSDLRHVCFSNLPAETSEQIRYIDKVSKPYTRQSFQYYFNDKRTIIVKYNENIDFRKILRTVRTFPELNGYEIKCVQLFHPQSLFVEFDSEQENFDLNKFFDRNSIFNMKIFEKNAFVHFYSHRDLQQWLRKNCKDSKIRATPIYVEIHSEKYFQNSFDEQKSEITDESQSSELTNKAELTDGDFNSAVDQNKSEKTLESRKTKTSVDLEIEKQTQTELLVEEEILKTSNETEISNENFAEKLKGKSFSMNFCTSDDDLRDFPSDIDDEQILLDETVENNADFEFVRAAKRNLNKIRSQMENAVKSSSAKEPPSAFSYADDFVLSIQNRAFAEAFRDFIDFQIERHRKAEKFHIFSSIKKPIEPNSNHRQTPLSNEISTVDNSKIQEKKKKKKKRSKRNKNKTSKPKVIPETIEASSESLAEDEGETEENNVVNSTENCSQRFPEVFLDDEMKPRIVVSGEENGPDLGENEEWCNIKHGGKTSAPVKKTKTTKMETNVVSASKTVVKIENVPPPNSLIDTNSVEVPADCRVFVHQQRQFETFRSRLRRSFPSVNVHFNKNNKKISIEGQIKSNVEQCLIFLQNFSTFRRSICVEEKNWPKTTADNVIRMQHSTAEVQLDPKADYQRIFRSVYRLIDFHFRQQFHQQQSVSCRRSKNRNFLNFIEFPIDKNNFQQIKSSMEKRLHDLIETRFIYVPIALSADLLTTKRWKSFYDKLRENENLNKTILIRKISSILQIYGLHAHVQLLKTSISDFLEKNRYETEIIENEKSKEFSILFAKDFVEMQNQEQFRDAELLFVQRSRQKTLSFRCFHEKFGLVQENLKRIRSELSTVVLPIKSSFLSRLSSMSNEIQTISEISKCVVTIEKDLDPTGKDQSPKFNWKIFGRSTSSTDEAQRLIKQFEEKKYCKRQIRPTELRLFNEKDFESIQNQCRSRNVSCDINFQKNFIEIEGLHEDLNFAEHFLYEFSAKVGRRTNNDSSKIVHWTIIDLNSQRLIVLEENIKDFLESNFRENKKKKLQLEDDSNQIRRFDLETMFEISDGTQIGKLERHLIEKFPLPTDWKAMSTVWERVFLARNEDSNNWNRNREVQRILHGPNLLPETWILEIYRVQNSRLYQEYMAYKKVLSRKDNTERTLYRLAEENLIDDVCANGFKSSHIDSDFSNYGQGCHFYQKAVDIDRTMTLLEKNRQTIKVLSGQTQGKAPIRYLFVCKVLVGDYTKGEASTKTCPRGFQSTVNDIENPEIFVTYHRDQVLPEYLISYRSAIF